MPKPPLIIIGSAPLVQEEVAEAVLGCCEASPHFLALNHQGICWPIVHWWATLHPEAMVQEDWLQQRRQKFPGWPSTYAPPAIIPRAIPGIDNYVLYKPTNIHGSSALYATRWAIAYGYSRILLAGVHLAGPYAQFRQGWVLSTPVLRQADISAQGGWLQDFLLSIY